MSQYEELWDADAQYVYSLAGDANYTCILSGRRFWKTVEGKALIAYGQIHSGYSGPLYVSTDPGYVTYRASSGGPFTYSGTIQYLGMTWYYSATDHFFGGNLTSTGGPALKMPQSYSSIALAAQALLEIANVHLAKEYVSDGSAVYTLDLTPIKSCIGSHIEWSAVTPTDTSVSVSASLNGIAYFPCVTDSSIPILEPNHDYSEATLYIKVSLHTDDVYWTPSFESLFVSVADKNSNNTIKLTLGNGNVNSIQNAFGYTAVRHEYALSDRGSFANTEYEAGHVTLSNSGTTVNRTWGDAEQALLWDDAVSGTWQNVKTADAYKASGTAAFEFVTDEVISSGADATLEWDETLYPDTSISAEVKVGSGNWTTIQNGGHISALQTEIARDDTFQVRFALSTENPVLSPVLTGFAVTLTGTDDTVRVYVNYDGAGTLQGDSGVVAAFSNWFEPIEMIQKPNQMETEHVEITDISAVGDLIQIYYHDAQETEHIEIANITAVGVLTDVGDL